MIGNRQSLSAPLAARSELSRIAAAFARAPWRSFVVGVSAGVLLALLNLVVGNSQVSSRTSRVPPTAERIATNPSPPLLLAANDAIPTLVTAWQPAPGTPLEEIQLDEIVIRASAGRWQAEKPSAPTIELETREVLVSGRAVAAVIMLKRTGSTAGRVRVRCKTVPGSAVPAEDYQSLSTMVQFGDRQAMQTLFVPILQPPPNGESRTFSVTLERAPRGPSLGSVTRTTVTILGDN
jgi:hypothetical protein